MIRIPDRRDRSSPGAAFGFDPAAPAALSAGRWRFTPARRRPMRLAWGFTLDHGPGSTLAQRHQRIAAMQIGQLAKRTGVPVDTVRYYEKSGLLTPESRLASGYRRYSDEQVSRLRFIRRAQELGFTLKDIRELLGISKQKDVAKVKRAAERKLADVEERLVALTRMRDGLATLVATCPGHGRAADCPILKALGEERLQ